MAENECVIPLYSFGGREGKELQESGPEKWIEYVTGHGKAYDTEIFIGENNLSFAFCGKSTGKGSDLIRVLSHKKKKTTTIRNIYV